MIEDNPWKTPFGRLLIGSSIVAAVVGFSVAAGVTTYFRSPASTPEEVVGAAVESPAVTGFEQEQAEAETSPRDVMSDPRGYAEALAGLGPPPQAEQPSAVPPTEAAEEGSLMDQQASTDDNWDDGTADAHAEAEDVAQ